MSWFKKTKKPKAIRHEERRSSVPEGLWVRCDGCKEIVYSKELRRNLKICPKCGHHFRVGPEERLRLLLDQPADASPRDGTSDDVAQPAEAQPAEARAIEAQPIEALFGAISPGDPLRFKDTKPYRGRLKAYQKHLGVKDALMVRAGSIEGRPAIVAVMDYRFMGGSMGSVVGEGIARAAETAVERSLPLIIVSASGGARMQEGALSLMQMAKISAALARVRDARLPYLSILTLSLIHI